MAKLIHLMGKVSYQPLIFNHDNSQLHIVSSLIASIGGIIDSRDFSGDKFNEVSMLQGIIQKLNIKGSVIVADTLYCQIETAKNNVKNIKRKLV